MKTTKTGIYKCKLCQNIKTITIRWNKPFPKNCYCDKCHKQTMLPTWNENKIEA